MPIPTAVRSPSRDEDLAALEALWKEIRSDLESRRDSIAAEIRSYPTPITRCDAQFNHLYEQRARLASELDCMIAIEERSLGRRDYLELIRRFVASEPYTDDRSERELRRRATLEFGLLAGCKPTQLADARSRAGEAEAAS